MNKYYRILTKILSEGKVQENKKGQNMLPAERTDLHDPGRFA